MHIKLTTREIWLKEWAAIIKECKASGQKVDLYCEQYGLSRGAYYYWLCKVKEAALKQAGFVESPVLVSEQILEKTAKRRCEIIVAVMRIKYGFE